MWGGELGATCIVLLRVVVGLPVVAILVMTVAMLICAVLIVAVLEFSDVALVEVPNDMSDEE